MTELLSLGYVGVAADQLEDWASFGPKILGLQLDDRSRKTLAFRMDDRTQRLLVGPAGERPFFGWEVSDAGALLALADRFEALEIPFEWGSPSLTAERKVEGLIRFCDPAGAVLEAFYGAEVSSRAFRPGRAISGFRTGSLGMGHIVLTVSRIEDALPFYRDVLGFRLSDYAERPFRACFLHINARHHSLALVETGVHGIHHLMMELFSLDDVGQAYDLIDPGKIGATLGRHTNDFMTSFYVWTPSKFMVEYGWGGRDIEPGTWQSEELKNGPSLWGHDRTWLSEERRAEAKALRLKGAAEGSREPIQVMAGNHTLMQGVCPWWDSVRTNADGDPQQRPDGEAS